MLNESTKKASSASSPSTSASTSPSLSSSSSVDSYIGSFLSLTSKYEIRYEGVLYYLNPQESTLGLKTVRCYGTEGRKNDGPQISPSDKVYEYIMFRGSDIKDLQVKSSPPAQKEEPIQNDPAIIQSHSWVGPSSPSKSVSIGGRSLTEFSSYQEYPALANTAYPGTSPSNQSGTPMGPGGPLQATQNANVASLAVPMYWPEYNGSSSNIPYAPQHLNPLVPMSTTITSLPVKVQNHLQHSATPASITSGLTYSSDVAPVPSLNTSNSVHLNITPSPTLEQHSTTSSMPSFSSVKSSQPSHHALLTANRSSMAPFPSFCQDKNAIEAPFVVKADSDSVKALSVEYLPCLASSVLDSTLSPLLKVPPTLLTPSQLAQPGPPMHTSIQYPYPNQEDMLSLNSASPNLSSSITTPAVQAPLLPLRHSSQQFTEEFDFEAMNEKFKKDEVWGYLGGGVILEVLSKRIKQKGLRTMQLLKIWGMSGVMAQHLGLIPNLHIIRMSSSTRSPVIHLPVDQGMCRIGFQSE
ncbi:Protein decapping like [Actinidia chinensis var. chinensis]|uniref:Protein decapping like n=1 Tax=Actinidia chinensis var. chinensis TaxID=1590841 RepID=A0A2R6Q341_ACTCC|nr:Protein decapping like [Actinidia chinensis var. chinensis]